MHVVCTRSVCTGSEVCVWVCVPRIEWQFSFGCKIARACAWAHSHEWNCLKWSYERAFVQSKLETVQQYWWRGRTCPRAPYCPCCFCFLLILLSVQCCNGYRYCYSDCISFIFLLYFWFCFVVSVNQLPGAFGRISIVAYLVRVGSAPGDSYYCLLLYLWFRTWNCLVRARMLTQLTIDIELHFFSVFFFSVSVGSTDCGNDDADGGQIIKQIDDDKKRCTGVIYSFILMGRRDDDNGWNVHGACPVSVSCIVMYYIYTFYS